MELELEVDVEVAPLARITFTLVLVLVLVLVVLVVVAVGGWEAVENDDECVGVCDVAAEAEEEGVEIADDI